MLTMLLENVVFEQSKSEASSYDIDEYVRWHCLLEAIAVISEKADYSNIDLDNNSDWIKPLALQKYIRERFLSKKVEIVDDLGGDSMKFLKELNEQ